MNKKELRKKILACRNSLSEIECKTKSEKITNKVIALEEFQKCNKVLLYASIKKEVDTLGIYEAAKCLGKDIYYPRVMGAQMEFYHINEATEFETSAFGITEPKPETTVRFVPNAKDVVLLVVPGVVFDKEGNRIGYGGGYYDKYIERLERLVLPDNLCKVAIAYECQLVECGRIGTKPHDRKVDLVLADI